MATPTTDSNGTSADGGAARKPADPLDDPNFNPTEFINHLFPNEQSLSKIDTVLMRLKGKIRRLESEIREIVRSQTEAGERGKQELEEAKAAIQALFTKMENIKLKAEQSEEMVTEITRDIKSLDYAKRHLTSSITELKRLGMLVSTVEQLQQAANARQYGQAASYLSVVLQLVDHFKAYTKIRKIQELTDTVANIQSALKRQIMKDFDESFRVTGELTGDAKLLSDACSVVGKMDLDFRTTLISWYCDLNLREYRSKFLGEVGKLENTHLRYGWLRRTLKDRQPECEQIFPADWNVPEVFTERFCEQTRRDLTLVLQSNEATMDVKVLLKMFQQTVDFEASLAQRFGRMDNDVGQRVRSPNPDSGNKFFGIISACFEQYMSHYMDAEDKSLSELFDRFRTMPSDDKDESGIQITVFSSSTDLFFFYRTSLTRCVKLSTRKALSDLSKLYAKYLSRYVEFLASKLPRDPNRVVEANELVDICRALNTAVYCCDTAAQLENKIKEKIDAAFVEKVDFKQEVEQFENLVIECIRVLTKQLMNVGEPSFAAMLKLSYSTMVESSGDQSAYLGPLGKDVQARIVLVRGALHAEKHFRAVCMKFAEAFIARWMDNLYKCKPVNEIGAYQLLLDTNAIKTMLLALHFLGAEDMNDKKTETPTAFTKFVTKGCTAAETLLKVVRTPHDPPEVFVESYTLFFADNNLSNFMRVLDLKGLKANEQKPLIDLFQKQFPPLPSGGATVVISPDTPTPAATGLRLKDVSRSVVANTTTMLKNIKLPTGTNK